MLVAPVITNSSGLATIPAGYTCPFAGALLYLVSNGGTVGSANSPNANARLMTAVGPCNSIASGAQYVVTEATTVAAAYSLAQFYTAGSIGASVTNLTGITNAFATAATLADPITNATPGSTMPANTVSPAPRINSVANIVNQCLVSSSACAAFFSATTISTIPTNTLDALFNLAHQPTANVATLYGQSLVSTAYSPALTAQPADWTMFVTCNSGGLNSPSGIAIDSKGSVWVANYFYTASKFSPIGAPVFPAGITGYGINNSYGLAIDLADNAWIPNEQPFQSAGNIGSVTELTSAGVPLSGVAGYVGGGLDYPLSVAIDPNGTVWVVDYGDSYLTLLNTVGTPLYGQVGFTSALFAFPVAVAVDGNHFAWTGNQSSNSVTRVSPDGSAFTNFVTAEGPSGIAIDQNNNIWTSNYYDNSVSLISNSGVVNGTFTALNSITRPQGIAIDGAGNVWVANYREPYLNELAGASASSPGTSLTPAAGIGADAGLLEAYAMAIDASGNIWISNQGSNTITKFIGLAAPVKTPLSGVPKLP
jgi:streptogramin lyase